MRAAPRGVTIRSPGVGRCTAAPSLPRKSRAALDVATLGPHHASAMPRATWSAIAMMVIIGFTPLEVGKVLASAM